MPSPNLKGSPAARVFKTAAQVAGQDPPAGEPGGPPRLGVGPHRTGGAGNCLMEYVAVRAGEPFSDLPSCTHPAVAALAWKINDAVSPAVRQQLVERAPALVGAGRGLSEPVRPLVLATIAAHGLELDPEHRYFRRLQRRCALQLDQARTTDPRDRAPATAGRRANWLHQLVPVSWAMTHFLSTTYNTGHDRDEQDQLAVGVLDDCLTTLNLTSAASLRSGLQRGAPLISG